MASAVVNEGLEAIGTDEYKDDDDTGSGAFEDSGLRKIRLSSTIKRIGFSAFKDCKSLRTVEFSEGLEVIGTQAFCGCGVESITTPKSLKTICGGAFLKCQNLRQVVLNDSMEMLGVNGDFEKQTEYGGVFQGCESLKTIELPSRLEFIGMNCFRDSGLESFTAPRTLRTVCPGAFCMCKHLREVQLNEGLEILGADECPEKEYIKGVF